MKAHPMLWEDFAERVVCALADKLNLQGKRSADVDQALRALIGSEAVEWLSSPPYVCERNHVWRYRRTADDECVQCSIDEERAAAEREREAWAEQIRLDERARVLRELTTTAARQGEAQ